MSEETSENSQAVGKKRSGLSFFKLFGFIVVIAVIVAAGYYFMNQGSGAVAEVNGQKISRSEYDERFSQLAASVASQGQSATTTEMQTAIKNQTLDNLVSEALLLQAASKEGIKANDTAISTQLTQTKSQFPDTAAFEKALTAQGYTDNTFKDYLTRTNIIQQYLSAHIATSSITASQAEITALYNQVAATNKTVPPLAQVRAQVENQIIQQKQQQLVTDYIAKLKTSSTINILLK